MPTKTRKSYTWLSPALDQAIRELIVAEPQLLSREIAERIGGGVNLQHVENRRRGALRKSGQASRRARVIEAIREQPHADNATICRRVGPECLPQYVSNIRAYLRRTADSVPTEGPFQQINVNWLRERCSRGERHAVQTAALTFGRCTVRDVLLSLPAAGLVLCGNGDIQHRLIGTPAWRDKYHIPLDVREARRKRVREAKRQKEGRGPRG